MSAPKELTSYIPDQGDVVWLTLDPRVGHEQSGHRPALVLSPRLLTERTGLAVICPITSKVKGLPYEVVLKKTKTNGAIMPIHLRSVDVNARKAKFIEKISVGQLETVLRRVEALLGR
ncbi:MAG: type II toxin-antitoxin system PemK/MazF family toxin [bacterium]|nr:type II toxin-antitoxin system PemK/MazF family toxin [bacterium]